MTDQTTTTPGSGAGLAGQVRQGQGPSPRDLAARAAAREAAPVPPAAPDPEPAESMQVTGAQALVAALERLGVDVVFGIPGGAILPAYDPLFDSRSVRHILGRPEQGARPAPAGYPPGTRPPRGGIAPPGPGGAHPGTPAAPPRMGPGPPV